MVDHEKRQATTGQVIAKVGGTFRYTVQDLYKEMRARCMLTSALFVATKEHYLEEIEQNRQKIQLLQKTMSTGKRELMASKSNILKPHEQSINMESITNLRDNFVLWAAHYTDQSAETTIGIKHNHVSKLISVFDSLLHSRQKLVNQIGIKKTALKAATMNNTIDRMVRDASQKLRVLESSFTKMKEKSLAARDVNVKYREIVKSLTEQIQRYPILIKSLEKELERMESLYKKDYALISKKAREYLQKVLKEKKDIEKKTEASREIHRRTLRERSKRSWNLKKQMGESKEIRRLIRQALDMDEGLVTNGFMLDDEAEHRWNTAMEREIQTEELMDLQITADCMKPAFNIPKEDCVKKVRMQTTRMKMLRKMYETTYQKLSKKSKILDEMSAFVVDLNGKYLSSQHFQDGKIWDKKEAITEVTRVVHQKEKKLSITLGRVNTIVNEMTCLCDKFQYWAEVQNDITGDNWRSLNFMDFSTVPRTPEGIEPLELLKYFAGFKKNYFRLVRDILYNVGKFCPVFKESDEKYQVDICQIVLKQSKSDRTTSYLEKLRAKYSHLPAIKPPAVNTKDTELYSGVGENSISKKTRKEEEYGEDVTDAKSNHTHVYKDRLQMKKVVNHIVSKNTRRLYK